MRTARHLPPFVAALLLVLLSPVRSPQAAGPQETPSTFAITGGTVLTVTGGAIPRGVVLVQDGRIAAVGADVEVPADAARVDATGRYVSPGLVDAHSHIAADSINEGGTSVSSMTGIADVFDPTDVNIYRDLAGGLTTSNILHGSANPIGGKNLVIKLRWGGDTTADYRFEGALPGIKFALGENPKDMRQFGQRGPTRYPTSRLGVEFVIRDAFTRARAYQQAWQHYEARRAKGEQVLPPRRDLQLEPLVEVLEGRRLVHAHCYRADEILMLLRLAEELGFRIATLQHVLEGYKVADEIAAHGAGASTFSDWWGYKIEAIDAIPWNAALMSRRGVLVSVNSDDAELGRRLNTEAAKSIKWGGLSDEEALALVTINPAKQLRIDDRVGSIEPGKDADLVIWDRHPLSSYALADRVYIDGRLYYDRSKEDARVQEIEARREALRKAEKALEKQTPEADEPTEDTAKTDRHEETTTSETEQADARGGQNGTNGGAPQGDAPATGTAAAAAPWPEAPWPGPPEDTAPLAIVNARIHPVTQPVIERGTIVIRAGRIESLGAEVTAPEGAEVIDAAGADVYPGFIDASSTLGLAEPGPRGFQDTTEMLPFNPHLRTRMAFHPDSDAIPVARANGITTVAVRPTGGLLGGEVAVMNLDGWTWEEATLRPRAGLSFQFPSLTPARRSGGREQPEKRYEDLKKARDHTLAEVADLLERARAFARMAPSSRPTDWVQQALIPVVERALPLIVEVDREADIREAVAFARRTEVRIVLVGGLEAGRVASLLKENGVDVIVGPVLRLPGRRDDHHAAPYRTAAQLSEAGVRIAFTSNDGSSNVRMLPYHAAKSVAWGLDRDRAIRALTIDAATILGVADRVGSLEPGKLANLFLARGDPLEVRTGIVDVIINGRRVGVDSHQRQLYERFAARPCVACP